MWAILSVRRGLRAVLVHYAWATEKKRYRIFSVPIIPDTISIVNGIRQEYFIMIMLVASIGISIGSGKYGIIGL
jgi:hypothetical protein